MGLSPTVCEVPEESLIPRPQEELFTIAPRVVNDHLGPRPRQSRKALTSVLSQDRDHSPSPEMCPEMPTSPNWEPLWQHTISLENTEELKMFPQSL